MQRLETERLMLRSFCESDLDDFYAYASKPNVGPNAGWKPHESTQESWSILHHFMASEEVYAIVLKETKKVIGSIGMHKESMRSNPFSRSIGYVLSPEHWGNSYAGEAVEALLKHLFFDLGLQLVSCYHYAGNEQSKRVIEKSGFKFEGVLRASVLRYDGVILDDWCYSMTKEEYVNHLEQSKAK